MILSWQSFYFCAQIFLLESYLLYQVLKRFIDIANQGFWKILGTKLLNSIARLSKECGNLDTQNLIVFIISRNPLSLEKPRVCDKNLKVPLVFADFGRFLPAGH
jgi:hypothetical protein